MKKVNKTLKKIIFILALLIFPIFSISATIKGYNDNRPELADSFLSTMKKRVITSNDIGTTGAMALRKIVDAYENESELAKLMKNGGRYDGDLAIGTYSNKGRYTQADWDFIQDYGTAATLCITPYDVGYFWGGNHANKDALDNHATRNGMDCSGFTHFALRAGFGYDHSTQTANTYNSLFATLNSSRAGRGPTNEIVVRTMDWASDGRYDHIGFVSGKAQVHARGSEKPSKWKTIDVTGLSNASSMREIPVMSLLKSKGVEPKPYSPDKISSLIAAMRDGNRAGGTDVATERNSDHSEFDITNAQQFILRLNLETTIFKPFLKAISGVLKEIIPIAKVIFIILAALDFMVFWLKSVMSTGDFTATRTIVPFSQRFIRYAGYLTLINYWETLVVKMTVQLFGKEWGAMLTNSSTSNKAFGSYTYIYEKIILSPLTEIIDAVRTIFENVIDPIKEATVILVPFGQSFLGLTQVNVSLFNYFTVYAIGSLGMIAIILMVLFLIIIVIYAVMLVINVFLATVEALIVAVFSLFPVMLGGVDFLQGFGIVAAIQNLMKPLMKITVAYIFIMMTLDILDKLNSLLPSNNFVLMIFFPARVLLYAVVYLIMMFLYRGIGKRISESF